MWTRTREIFQFLFFRIRTRVVLLPVLFSNWLTIYWTTVEPAVSIPFLLKSKCEQYIVTRLWCVCRVPAVFNAQNDYNKMWKKREPTSLFPRIIFIGAVQCSPLPCCIYRWFDQKREKNTYTSTENTLTYRKCTHIFTHSHTDAHSALCSINVASTYNSRMLSLVYVEWIASLVDPFTPYRIHQYQCTIIVYRVMVFESDWERRAYHFDPLPNWCCCLIYIFVRLDRSRDMHIHCVYVWGECMYRWMHDWNCRFDGVS